MALTITNLSYADEDTGLYVIDKLQQTDSLKYLTVRENVNYKEVLNKVAGTHLVKDLSCDFNQTADGTNTSTLTLTEQVLEVEPFQINIDVCKKTMLSDWSYNQSDDFVAFAMSYLSASIADSVETSIWQGNTATSGQFNGISATGMTTDSASAAYTADNVIANLGSLAAAIPSAVYGKDLQILHQRNFCIICISF